MERSSLVMNCVEQFPSLPAEVVRDVCMQCSSEEEILLRLTSLVADTEHGSLPDVMDVTSHVQEGRGVRGNVLLSPAHEGHVYGEREGEIPRDAELYTPLDDGDVAFSAESMFPRVREDPKPVAHAMAGTGVDGDMSAVDVSDDGTQEKYFTLGSRESSAPEQHIRTLLCARRQGNFPLSLYPDELSITAKEELLSGESAVPLPSGFWCFIGEFQPGVRCECPREDGADHVFSSQDQFPFRCDEVEQPRTHSSFTSHSSTLPTRSSTRRQVEGQLRTPLIGACFPIRYEHGIYVAGRGDGDGNCLSVSIIRRDEKSSSGTIPYVRLLRADVHLSEEDPSALSTNPRLMRIRVSEIIQTLLTANWLIVVAIIDGELSLVFVFRSHLEQQLVVASQCAFYSRFAHCLAHTRSSPHEQKAVFRLCLPSADNELHRAQRCYEYAVAYVRRTEVRNFRDGHVAYEDGGGKEVWFLCWKHYSSYFRRRVGSSDRLRTSGARVSTHAIGNFPSDPARPHSNIVGVYTEEIINPVKEKGVNEEAEFELPRGVVACQLDPHSGCLFGLSEGTLCQLEIEEGTPEQLLYHERRNGSSYAEGCAGAISFNHSGSNRQSWSIPNPCFLASCAIAKLMDGSPVALATYAGVSDTGMLQESLFVFDVRDASRGPLVVIHAASSFGFGLSSGSGVFCHSYHAKNADAGIIPMCLVPGLAHAGTARIIIMSLWKLSKHHEQAPSMAVGIPPQQHGHTRDTRTHEQDGAALP